MQQHKLVWFGSAVCKHFDRFERNCRLKFVVEKARMRMTSLFLTFIQFLFSYWCYVIFIKFEFDSFKKWFVISSSVLQFFDLNLFHSIFLICSCIFLLYRSWIFFFLKLFLYSYNIFFTSFYNNLEFKLSIFLTYYKFK